MREQPKSGAVWFEIPCADLERAARFYETILDRRMKKDDFVDPMNSRERMRMFPTVPGGVSGALVKRPFRKPGGGGTMVYLNCDGELDAVIARVREAGGLILMPRTPVPGGYGAFACLKDTEGNHIGLHTSI
jgi:predicted enzyme related to lactoylglutathione lyase